LGPIFLVVTNNNMVALHGKKSHKHIKSQIGTVLAVCLCSK
jgi:hypothetical protein